MCFSRRSRKLGTNFLSGKRSVFGNFRRNAPKAKFGFRGKGCRSHFAHPRRMLVWLMNKKTFVIFGLLVLFAFAAFVFVGLRKEPPRAMLEKMAEKVDLQAKNVRYTQVGSSGMKWEITADSAQYRKKEDLALFDNVRAKVFMKDGRSFTMTGDKGVLNTRSKNLDINGNVVIVSESGDRFQTDRLSYRDALKRIETDQPVVIESKNARISGVGMHLNLNDEKVVILSGVRATSVVR